MKTSLDMLTSPIEIWSYYAWLHYTLYPEKSLKDKIKKDTLLPLVAGCLFWFPIQFLNFRWVPIHLRVFYENIVELIWDVFMSFVGNNDATEVFDKFLSKNAK